MRKLSLFIILLGFGCVVNFDTADALRLTLKRVVFEGPKRTEVITVINNSNKPETYRLGWRHFRMTADKSLVPVPEDALTPEIKPVVDMVRFAPRRFTVPPKSSQQVRMMLRTPANLPDGEYRSHFWVQPEVDLDELRREELARAKRTGTEGGVSMIMLAGVTMPVIVRKGALEASASIQGVVAKVTGGFVEVSWSLLRDGNRSLYGDIDYVCNPGATDSYNLRVTRGIAMYSELNQRDFNLRIEKPTDRPACRSLSLSFTQTEGFEGARTVVLAEAETEVIQVR